MAPFVISVSPLKVAAPPLVIKKFCEAIKPVSKPIIVPSVVKVEPSIVPDKLVDFMVPPIVAFPVIVRSVPSHTIDLVALPTAKV